MVRKYASSRKPVTELPADVDVKVDAVSKLQALFETGCEVSLFLQCSIHH
jgi:hypothetical protein